MSGRPGAATRASSRSRSVQPTTASSTTRSTKSTAKAPAVKTATTKAARQPLGNAENSPERRSYLPMPSPVKPSKKAASNMSFESEREPIKAYLRIRPQGNAEQLSAPYLEPLSDTTVHMSNPSHTEAATHTRTSTALAAAPTTYTFTHIFPPATSQSTFFQKTTLPLIRAALCQGENGLLFAYGVTNSGKTYTVQGAPGKDKAGILPRTLDVIFNSIYGLQGEARYRPVRLQGIEPAQPSDNAPLPKFREPELAEVLGDDTDSVDTDDMDSDPSSIEVDRNYEYSIWLSYAEVYNEKIYDLLASTTPDAEHDIASRLPRPAGAPPPPSHPLLLKRKALSLKPSPSADAFDDDTPGCTGKYVAGLKQVRVRSATDAKAVVKMGQLHRRVFGTLANSQSSRSHGVVTIKILKHHRGEKNDPTAIQTSRLTIVDLAGSERTKHTQTTGDRLKEAGNINKSLMVLGQCMEIMRANQKKVAQSLAVAGRSDTRDVKKTLGVIPFRHSKLTEMLMDYFVGDGRAVMIVNVNPYDTGYDENSHVMKFAAIAREVQINNAPAPVRNMPAPAPVAPKPSSKKAPALPIRMPSKPKEVHRRQVTISSGGKGGRVLSQTQLEVLEEDEEPGDGEDDDDSDSNNPLVDALFEEIENLQHQLFESQMRCAIVEAETREEVMREMEERMLQMELRYRKRWEREVEQQEAKTDAKIEMLHHAGMLTPYGHGRVGKALEDVEEEEDVEMSLRVDEGDVEPQTPHHAYDEEPEDRSPSPLAGRGARRTMDLDELRPLSHQSRQPSHEPPAPFGFQPYDDDDDDMYMDPGSQRGSPAPDAARQSSVKPASSSKGNLFIASSPSRSPSQGSASSSSSSGHKRNHSSIDDLGKLELPPVEVPKKPRARRVTRPASDDDYEDDDIQIIEPPLKQAKARSTRAGRHTGTSSRQAIDIIDVDEDPSEAAVVIPNKKARQEAVANGGPNVEYVPRKGETDTVKKKKRQLGKKPVMTEEQIAYIASQEDPEAGKTVRRARTTRKFT